MLVLDDIWTPTFCYFAVDYVAAYEKASRTKPAIFGANVYDAGLMLESGHPGRS